MDDAERADFRVVEKLPPCPECGKTYGRIWKRMFHEYRLRCDLCPHVWAIPRQGLLSCLSGSGEPRQAKG